MHRPFRTASLRRNRPFVAINCSALPPQLLESELFGYVDGAFTGAKKREKPDYLKWRIRERFFWMKSEKMDLSMQTRSLRVLQEREIMRIGDNKVISVDVRVIVATNRDLYQEVLRGGVRGGPLLSLKYFGYYDSAFAGT